MPHRHSLSVKISQLNFIKGSKKYSRPNLSEHSPQNLTSEFKSGSLFCKNQSTLQSKSSNKNLEFSQISQFNSELRKNNKMNKHKKENIKTKGNKSKLFLKKINNKKSRITKILKLNLNNQPSKKLMIDIKKNSNSLKNIATTLNQVQLNYIFSQKKSRELGNKFDLNYIYSNKTPKTHNNLLK
jgi:hypothetical protein